MPLRLKQLPTFDSVAAGRKASISMPLGIRLHVIWLELGNNAVANNEISDLVGNIAVKVNGKEQRLHSGVELDALNSLEGAQFAAQNVGTAGQADRRHYLPIWLAEPWRNEQREIAAMAWNLAGIDSMQIEVNIVAGLAAPIVQGWYEFDDPTGQLGIVSKVFRQDFSAVGTSRDISGWDRERRDFIQSIHFFPTVETTPRYVSQIKFTAGGAEVREDVTVSQNQTSLIARRMNPDLSAVPRYDLVLDYDDPLNNALNTAPGGRLLNELTAKVTWNASANGSMPVLIQRAGLPE